MSHIEILTGDMFASGAEALVIPVNAHGVHGAGLAKIAAKRWPATMEVYTASAKIAKGGGAFHPGGVWAFRAEVWVLCAATKNHWRDPSRMEWVRTASDGIVKACAEHKIASLALPAIGAGLGGLHWDDVRPVLVDAAERMTAAGVKVFLYGPDAGPKKRVSR